MDEEWCTIAIYVLKDIPMGAKKGTRKEYLMVNYYLFITDPWRLILYEEVEKVCSRDLRLATFVAACAWWIVS